MEEMMMDYNKIMKMLLKEIPHEHIFHPAGISGEIAA